MLALLIAACQNSDITWPGAFMVVGCMVCMVLMLYLFLK